MLPSDNPGVSLAQPEAEGPLRRERLRTARLYFCCERGRTAKTRSRCCGRRCAAGSTSCSCARRRCPARDRALRADLPPPLRHLQRPLHRQRRPRPGPRLRRRRRPRRPGRHARRRGARDARPRRDHRPVDPLQGADRRMPPRRARRLHQRRAHLGDADQGGAARGRARADPPRRREAPHPFFAIGGIDASNAAQVVDAGARADLRRAGDPRRRGPGRGAQSSCEGLRRRSGRRRPVR